MCSVNTVVCPGSSVCQFDPDAVVFGETLIGTALGNQWNCMFASANPPTPRDQASCTSQSNCVWRGGSGPGGSDAGGSDAGGSGPGGPEQGGSGPGGSCVAPPPDVAGFRAMLTEFLEEMQGFA